MSINADDDDQTVILLNSLPRSYANFNNIVKFH